MSQKRSSPARRHAPTIGLARGAAAIALCVAAPLSGEPRSTTAPATAAVKSFARDKSAPEAGSATTPANAATQPTLPDARLPQYQFGHEQRLLPTEEQLRDSRLRFLVALPRQPLLLEARITIDGEPFRMAREQRVQEILKGLDVSVEGSTAPQPAAEASAENVPRAIPETFNAASSPSSGAVDQVRRYFAATGGAPDADEVRWLLTNWIDGPVLLLLQDHFQRSRAVQRPGFDVLDRDGDGEISSAELEGAERTLSECDLNRDDIVAFLEIAACARDARRQASLKPAAGRLVTLLPPASDELVREESARVLTRRLMDRYAWEGESASPLIRFDLDQSGALEPADVGRLRTRPADVVLSVAFRGEAPGDSSLTLEEFNPDVIDELLIDDEAPTVLTILSDGCELRISAAQGGGADQVSLGAVDDGYPLLPELDPSGDDRLTLRERRGIAERIRRFDQDGDGRILREEARSPIRLCIGLGPVVHQELGTLRAGPIHEPSVPSKAPDWFVRMDRNRDNDLARGEFPGTDDQFTHLDADGDALISVREAVQFTETEQSNATSSPMTSSSSDPQSTP